MKRLILRRATAIVLGVIALAALAPRSTAAEPAVRTPGGSGDAVARVEFSVPSPSTVFAAALGIDPEAAVAMRDTPEAIATHTTTRVIASRIVSDADTLERKLAAYHERFNGPEDEAFDRAGLIDDIARRTSIEACETSRRVIVRVRMTSMDEAKTLCELVADTFASSYTNQRARRLQKSRDSADRIVRELQTDVAALDAQAENSIVNAHLGSEDAAASEHTDNLGDINRRLTDIEIALIGKSPDAQPQDDAVKALVETRTLLTARRDSLRQLLAEQAIVRKRVRDLDRERDAKQELMSAAQRASLALQDEMNTQALIECDAEPIIETTAQH